MDKEVGAKVTRSRAVTPKTTSAKQDTKKRSLGEIVREPSTWAGVLTIANAVLTSGVGVLADPQLLTQIAAGLSLVLVKER